MPTLFDPLKLGALTLPNRIVLAPLTRSRALADSRVPSDLAVEYYRQRAGAGMIISEATSVTPMGVGYAATPGIWSDEQTEGWKNIVRAVHEAGGRILLQLWHVGRISDPMFLDGATPVAASARSSRPAMFRWCGPEKGICHAAARAATRIIPGVIAAPTKRAPKMPRPPASMAWKSTARTAICSTSFCRTRPITAATLMAATARTAPA